MNSNILNYRTLLRILSFKENVKGQKKIVIGETYDFTLLYLIGIDYSIPEIVDGQEIYMIRGNPRRLESCFYKSIFISKFYPKGYYYVESLNLKGLHYIPIEKTTII